MYNVTLILIVHVILIKPVFSNLCCSYFNVPLKCHIKQFWLYSYHQTINHIYRCFGLWSLTLLPTTFQVHCISWRLYDTVMGLRTDILIANSKVLVMFSAQKLMFRNCPSTNLSMLFLHQSCCNLSFICKDRDENIIAPCSYFFTYVWDRFISIRFVKHNNWIFISKGLHSISVIVRIHFFYRWFAGGNTLVLFNMRVT